MAAKFKLKSTGKIETPREVGRTVEHMDEKTLSKFHAYNCQKPIMIFSQMRSGSTLMLRLINQACARNFISEEITTLSHFVGLYENIIDNKSEHPCRLGFLQPGDDAPWEYDCLPKNERLFKLFWYMQNTLGFHNFAFKCASFAVNGYEEVSEKFLKMIDFFYSSDFEKTGYASLQDAEKPKRVWLVRQTDKIIKSIRTTPKINEKLSHLRDEDLAIIFDRQRDTFSRLSKTNDAWIMYDQLVLDPKSALEDIGLAYDSKIVEQVMKLKVR